MYERNQSDLRIWPQSYVPPIISTILYFLIFGNVIGHRIGLLQGVPYITYIAPGLIMMSLIMVSLHQHLVFFFWQSL